MVNINNFNYLPELDNLVLEKNKDLPFIEIAEISEFIGWENNQIDFGQKKLVYVAGRTNIMGVDYFVLGYERNCFSDKNHLTASCKPIRADKIATYQTSDEILRKILQKQI